MSKYDNYEKFVVQRWYADSAKQEELRRQDCVAQNLALRKADEATKKLDEIIASNEQRAAKIYQRALELVKAGRKAEAAAEMRRYRAYVGETERLLRRRQAYDAQATEFRVASATAQTTAALCDLARVAGATVNDTMRAMDEVRRVADEMSTVDDAWNDAFASLDNAQSDSSQIPSVDEMMRELEKTAALEVRDDFRSRFDAARFGSNDPSWS